MSAYNNSGLTPQDQALGFKPSDVAHPQAEFDGTTEPRPSAAGGAASQPQGGVLATGNESSLLSKAEQDAHQAGLPGATRDIKPRHEGETSTIVNDPVIPASAKEAPVMGVPPAEGVPFKKQVEGNALYYRGKITNNDDTVEQGAAILRGDVQ